MCGKRRSEIDEGDRDLSRNQRGERRAAALVRHVYEVRPGHRLEELARKMERGAVAYRSERDRTRPRLRLSDQVADRFDPRAGISDRYVGECADQ